MKKHKSNREFNLFKGIIKGGFTFWQYVILALISASVILGLAYLLPKLFPAWLAGTSIFQYLLGLFRKQPP